MKIRRFVAKDMRTALNQIKEELGADAVIMSNKKIPEGVELMAAVDYASQTTPDQPNAAQTAHEPASSTTDVKEDMVSLSASQQQAATTNISMSAPSQAEAKKEGTADSLQALLNRKVQLSGQKTQQPQMQQPAAQAPTSIEEQLKSFTDRLEQGMHQTPADEHGFEQADDMLANNMHEMSQSQMPHQAATMVDSQIPVTSNQELDMLKQEMASIRQLLEHQVSGLMWQDMAQRDPSRAMLTNKLMDIGFSEHMADQVSGYILAGLSDSQAWAQTLGLVANQLNTTNNDIIKRGGIVSVVGPTGVGKTTTVAKLAARFAQMHGADSVALISTDTYRIGGFQQLETYGRIISCQVKLAKDTESLELLLTQFSKKKLVLIDTAGMGQRDMRLAEHLSTLVSNSRFRIRNYLVLSANTQVNVMQENVERFKKIPLCGCIYTKLDESLSVGEIISTSIQNGLPIGYLTDGQRVPEDIKVANAEKLVSLADKMAKKYAVKNSINTRVITRAQSVVN